MKQFIVDRHTTPNTPTLEQVPTEKIPIYENRAAVTADLANLTVGQIVATKDTGNELAQPVNVVESGNLHAVSSNAVFEKCPRFPDYANQITIASSASSWTATEDCYCNYIYTTSTSTDLTLKVDGHSVSVRDSTGNSYFYQFVGYIKKGSVVTLNADLGNTNFIRFFKLR